MLYEEAEKRAKAVGFDTAAAKTWIDPLLISFYSWRKKVVQTYFGEGKPINDPRLDFMEAEIERRKSLANDA